MTEHLPLPGSNPCELNCLALGHNFYYNFGRVLDGTACDKVPGAVCVNGRCLVRVNEDFLSFVVCLPRTTASTLYNA